MECKKARFQKISLFSYKFQTKGLFLENKLFGLVSILFSQN
ncbi:hypothetical protein CAPGI0001_1011 [Capnocytophaga gingivalis ATCC 33624]|nr:hypothetical protein CAPGI0001_1011 [Capnocytophaga gingivalis ATCC 33624]